MPSILIKARRNPFIFSFGAILAILFTIGEVASFSSIYNLQPKQLPHSCIPRGISISSTSLRVSNNDNTNADNQLEISDEASIPETEVKVRMDDGGSDLTNRFKFKVCSS